jgi:hypothetical protein
MPPIPDEPIDTASTPAIPPVARNSVEWALLPVVRKRRGAGL